MLSKQRARVVRDVLYGYIEISPLAKSIIDTPEFQSLRNVKQLAAASFVFPSANHTRFEHCLGTYHVAGKFLDRLISQQPELGRTDQCPPRTVELIKIAGLVHDIGHCCWSHAFTPIAHENGLGEHEAWSAALFRYMVRKHELALMEDEVDLVCNAVLGTAPTNDEKQQQRWLFQIVCNKDFALDVDKLDYLLRDAYYIDMASHLQTDRIFAFARVIHGSLCFHEKVGMQVMDVFICRYRLHKELYRHPVVVAVELMIVDILRILFRVLGWKRLFQDPDHAWRTLGDAIIDYWGTASVSPQDPLRSFSESDCEELGRVREIYRRIQMRELYKPVSGAEAATCVTGDVIRVTNVVGFSSDPKENPISKVAFYNDDPQTLDKPFHTLPNDISALFTNTVCEVQNLYYDRGQACPL